MTKKSLPSQISANSKLTSFLHWYHWLVLLASIALTLSAWYVSKNQSTARQLTQFNNQSELIVALVEERMHQYETALWSGVSNFHSHQLEVSKEEWRRYTEALSIEEKFGYGY